MGRAWDSGPGRAYSDPGGHRLYRFVRNPMYVAVGALIFGQAVLFASWEVAVYGVVIAAAFNAFVRLYEEPTLRQAYGEAYDAYCADIPRCRR